MFQKWQQTRTKHCQEVTWKAGGTKLTVYLNRIIGSMCSYYNVHYLYLYRYNSFRISRILFIELGLIAVLSSSSSINVSTIVSDLRWRLILERTCKASWSRPFIISHLCDKGHAAWQWIMYFVHILRYSYKAHGHSRAVVSNFSGGATKYFAGPRPLLWPHLLLVLIAMLWFQPTSEGELANL